jgi:hypothetical protein
MMKSGFYFLLVAFAMIALSMASFDDSDENPSARVK